MSPSIGRALWWLLLAAFLAAGCARREPAPPAAARLARAQALIEAGNGSYRSGDFAGAARRYAAAAVVVPEDPAAQFGLGMALTKLGRDEEARAAYARARELAQQARLGAPAAEAPR
jgi:Flp pilus assembly protein TadD